MAGRAQSPGPRAPRRRAATGSRRDGARPGCTSSNASFQGSAGTVAVAVARRARPLGVAARAEIALARGAHAVLADPVAVVHEVARGRRSSAARSTWQPLQSRSVHWSWCSWQPKQVAIFGSSVSGRASATARVAANAVAVDDRACACGARSEGAARASSAASRTYASPWQPRQRSLVVRLRVAAAADGVGREVQRPVVAGAGHARVALDAVDPLAHVGAVLERVRRRLAGESRARSAHAASASARACARASASDAKREGPSHGTLQRARDPRRGRSASYACMRSGRRLDGAPATSQPLRDRHASARSPHGQATPRPSGSSGTTISISDEKRKPRPSGCAPTPRTPVQRAVETSTRRTSSPRLPSPRSSRRSVARIQPLPPSSPPTSPDRRRSRGRSSRGAALPRHGAADRLRREVAQHREERRRGKQPPGRLLRREELDAKRVEPAPPPRPARPRCPGDVRS